MSDNDTEMHNLLAALIEQARALGTRIAGDPERSAPCHFCGGPLPLWENLLVLQLAGVPAHVRCPERTLRAKLAEVGPSSEFPYEEFSQAVDRRVEAAPGAPSCFGTIDI